MRDAVVIIDRVAPFNPVKLLDRSGWTIDEQDERSLVLNQVDITSIRLGHMLKKNEIRINGEENLRRLKKAGHIRLDAKVFQTLWEDKSLIPESWKKGTKGKITYIYFDGTVLRGPDGHRDVLGLWWYLGSWCWICYSFWRGRSGNSPSAVLELD